MTGDSRRLKSCRLSPQAKQAGCRFRAAAFFIALNAAGSGAERARLTGILKNMA